MSDNATRFIQAFTTIEYELRKRIKPRDNDPKHLNFPTLVDRSVDLSPEQVEKLKSFSDLRNAIVHNPRDRGNEVIADPRDSAVQWLEKQVDLIVDPPLVMEVLNLQKPTVLTADDDLGAFLAIVRKHDYSQVPVVDPDGGLHLVTTNAVTRWLANEYIGDKSATVERVKMQDVHRFSEQCDSLVLKPRDLKAAEAVRIFAGDPGSDTPAAIIITEHGKDHQTPLGLCSPTDVATLLHALEV
ncbi:MAG TPA: hypothetical protein VK054_07660 [Beutenbergiaceae bacterium]|nr:hypothetical protein [Beutenbergiaceae bacterium]